MVDRRLVLLAAGAFVVTSDGTLVVGLLRQIARALSVSPAAAGQAVTAFAAVYALAAPPLVRATRRVPQERLLMGTLAVFALANAATAAAPTLATLIGARILAAACAGVFMAIVSALAADTAARERRGRGLATVVGGASAATALGVPLGTFLGSAVGWRAIFYGVSVLTALVAFATAATLRPGHQVRREPTRATLGGLTTLLTLTTTLLWATGSFTFFTYIAVILGHTAALDAAGLAGYLLIFGLAGVGGAALAGWLTDTKGPLPTLAAALALVAIALAGLGATAAIASRNAAIAGSALAIAAYGAGTWAITPPQQHRLLDSTGDERLLLSLNASAIYTGVALGSAIGGAVLATTGSTAAVCWTAAGIELAAVTSIAAARSLRLRRAAGHITR